MTGVELTLDRVADRFVKVALDDDRIRAVWIEGEHLAALRRPYRGLELHVAADEPDFPALAAAIESVLGSHFRVELQAVSETERFAKRFEVRLGDPGGGGPRLDVVLIIEQSHLLAKRPRAHVVALLDKTRHLPHVMDFSRR